MKWPPNQAWTSARPRQGYRHFEVIQCGGRGEERWVELFPILKKEIRLKVDWSELTNHKEWASGWLQLPESKDC